MIRKQSSANLQNIQEYSEYLSLVLIFNITLFYCILITQCSFGNILKGDFMRENENRLNTTYRVLLEPLIVQLRRGTSIGSRTEKSLATNRVKILNFLSRKMDI